MSCENCRTYETGVVDEGTGIRETATDPCDACVAEVLSGEIRRHYSVHGNDQDGWTLNVYRIEPQGHVTPIQNRPEKFDKLKDLLGVIVGNGDIEV